MPKGKHLPRVEIICARCRNSFSKVGSDTDRIYCSWECAKPRKTIQSFVCAYCGRSVQKTDTRIRRFCSVSCARNAHGKSIKERNLAAGIWHNYKQAKAELIKITNGCESCGWNEVADVLELHHRDRNRSNNHRSNLSILCPTCHTLLHWQEKTGQFAHNLGLPGRPRKHA